MNATSKAAALDATVSTDGEPGPSLRDGLEAAVVAAQTKVDKQKAHLEGAQAALKDAKAALAAAKKE